MKAWTSATIDGHCAYDHTHRWAAGARIFQVRGSSKAKFYCATCATKHHEAPEDTGELLTLEDAPTYPEQLKPQAFPIADRFDARMAAANDGRDAE